MGETKFNYAQSGYQAGLQTNFPYCVGGAMIGAKEGYKEDFVRVVTEPGKTAELNLVPLYEFPVKGIKIVKHDFKGPGATLGQPEELDKDELALVRMKVMKEGEIFHEIEQVIGESLSSEVVEEQKMELLAKANFKYDVEINLFKGKELTGGYKYNWTIPWSELEQAQEITFHTLARESGSEEELFDLLANMGQYSNYIPQPEIK